MSKEVLGTPQKALQTNLDPSTYGTFAEIGAGQEVARWFFRVGGAAGTIAKTMSAYDMTVSDAIYGQAERYVSRDRLGKMLDHEYALMLERLSVKRGATTRFFVFANTVAARSYGRQDESHGWMGIRFQTAPQSPPSEIIAHVRMLDRENVLQQEVLGTIGVNLIHGALYRHQEPVAILGGLLDSLSNERAEVDMIKFSGPGFESVDNRVMSLQLVEQGLTNSAMFTTKGEVVQASEVLYKKPVLVERGSFRPVTHVAEDMLRCGKALFVQEPNVAGQDLVVLLEMTLKELRDGDRVDHQDFLDRVDLLGSLGHMVLVSNYFEFHRLAGYLSRYTKNAIGLALGIPTLKAIFDDKYYKDLEGGILEALGRLFKNDLKLYVYPQLDKETGAIITASNLRVAPHLRHLYAYLLENLHIQAIRDCREEYLTIYSREALARIRSGDPTWEAMVPARVAKAIKERHLFQ